MHTRPFGLALGSIGVIVLLLSFVTYYLPDQIKESLLAMVVSQEIKAAKIWQERGAFEYDLALGDSGQAVSLLQAFLASQPGLLDSQYITGHYGELTLDAVRQFQHQNDLTMTGVVDQATRRYINQEFFSILCPEAPAGAKRLPLDETVTRSDPLELEYIPPGLALLEEVPTKGQICVEAEMMSAVERLVNAASDDGIKLMVTSGYRRPEVQQLILDYWLAVEGIEAYAEVAKPGHSEHQLGTAVDLTGDSINNVSVSDAFATSPEYEWLLENATDYGFVLSYPAGEEADTGYNFEPWHWRYLGIEAAK